MSLFEPVIDALNQASVRHVVVGGVAVVLHGYARLTADLDLAVDLAPAEAAKAIGALVSLGLQPTAPVDPSGFADPKVRAEWITHKNMRVFSMRDPANPLRQVDLFVEHVIDFEELWQRSELLELDRTSMRVASVPDLILLKQRAGRPQDLADIEALEAILERRSQHDG